MTYNQFGKEHSMTTIAGTSIKRISKNGTVITSMRMSKEVMDAATERANALGLSRTLYVENVLRKELGLTTVPTSSVLD
jgi:hypothetical protein